MRSQSQYVKNSTFWCPWDGRSSSTYMNSITIQNTTVKNPVISTTPVMPNIQLRMFFRINPVKSTVRLSKLLSLINAFMTEADRLFLHLNIKIFYSALINF